MFLRNTPQSSPKTLDYQQSLFSLQFQPWTDPVLPCSAATELELESLHLITLPILNSATYTIGNWEALELKLLMLPPWVISVSILFSMFPNCLRLHSTTAKLIWISWPPLHQIRFLIPSFNFILFVIARNSCSFAFGYSLYIKSVSGINGCALWNNAFSRIGGI